MEASEDPPQRPEPGPTYPGAVPAAASTQLEVAPVVRARRVQRSRAHRRRPVPVVPILLGLLVVGVVAAVFAANLAVGQRPTLVEGPAVGDAVEPLASAGCEPAQSGEEASVGGADELTVETVRIDSLEGPRSYRWLGAAEPDGPGRTELSGVILALPDAGQDAEAFSRTSLLELYAATRGYGVATVEPLPPEVALNSLGELGRPDDAGFVASVLDDVAATRCVDLRRVHVVGHGVGAQLAGYLACARPELMASVVGVGGGYMSDPCPLNSPVSLGLVWAEDDPISPFEGPSGAEALLERWSDRLGTTNAVTVPVSGEGVPDGSAWERRLDGRGGSTAELLRSVGGGHAWPVWANEQIVAFLDGHARSS